MPRVDLTSLFFWKGNGWISVAGLEECADNYAWHDVGRAVWRASKDKRRDAKG